MTEDARLATSICGIALRNPVLAASGTFGYGLEFASQVDLNALGGLVIKGLSLDPIEGNPPPRLFETGSGMINSVGLQNIGVRAFVSEKLPELAKLRTAVFANIFGYQAADYVEVIRVLDDHPGLAGYELNVSCPNTAHGGIFFSSDPALLSELVSAVKQVSKRPVVVKLSPNVSAIEPLARAAESAGADAISLVNTFIALAIDARTRLPRIGAGFGGLSGPAIKPIALRMVCQAARAVKIPVIGLGGIADGEDAAEFLIAGAAAVEVGTASFWDPASAIRIAADLGAFLRREGIANVGELVGSLKM
jgi:dihydroorotate dehydrogenase (NAD+) catalytic subunit